MEGIYRWPPLAERELSPQACAYTCDPGFTSFGKHVCGADGAFRGGRCTPAGKVPFLCGGVPEVTFLV